MGGKKEAKLNECVVMFCLKMLNIWLRLYSDLIFFISARSYSMLHDFKMLFLETSSTSIVV